MKKLLTSKKRIVREVALTLVVGLFAFGLFIPSTSSAGVINRLTAQFKVWDGDEISTTAAIPGIIIYSKTVTVPLDANTLFLTIATTGDCHDAAVAEFGAFLNGSPFNLGTTSCKWHSGMDQLAKPHCGDFHDNNINYTWCAPVQPGKKYLVELRLASDNGGEVFIEGAHFYIDATFLGAKNRCTEAP